MLENINRQPIGGKELNKAQGFTLIELTIVIALMMILYAIATPSLRNLAPSSRLKSSAREIQSLLTYARDVAMTEDVAYLVIFDLDEQRYWLTSSEDFDAENTTSSLVTSSLTTMPNFQQDTSVGEEGSNGQEFRSFRTVMIAGIPRKPATGVEIAAINITHDYSSSTYSYSNSELGSEGINSGEEITTGIEYIYFTPKGTSEDMVLYLQDKTGKMMSVQVERETGQVSIRRVTSLVVGYDDEENVVIITVYARQRVISVPILSFDVDYAVS
ncbi:TPA: prepilin-type N-terminal cleavage/methylation domain-containing protein [Candidatus Poribacteria bacterium]|nr:prepilin-type N-terminal cleavage/methylation domain-containing protein [Candidatus Poribacteria bacterium]